MQRLTGINIRLPTLESLLFLTILVMVVAWWILRVYGPHTVTPEVYVEVILPKSYGDLTQKPQPHLLPATRTNEKPYHVPVLLYHYISYTPDPGDKIRMGLSTPPPIFDKQLTELSEAGYTAISLDDFYDSMAGKYQLPEKPIILTFDDGYEDFYLNAYPILVKHQMKGIDFIITGVIGYRNYLAWKQIEEMNTSPYISFGAHTIHHYALASVKESIAEIEITQSKRTLEEHLGHEIHWFAYPYGSFNAHVVKLTQQAGYLGSVTTLPGTTQYESRLFYVLRYRAGTRLGQDLLQLIAKP